MSATPGGWLFLRYYEPPDPDPDTRYLFHFEDNIYFVCISIFFHLSLWWHLVIVPAVSSVLHHSWDSSCL